MDENNSEQPIGKEKEEAPLDFSDELQKKMESLGLRERLAEFGLDEKSTNVDAIEHTLDLANILEKIPEIIETPRLERFATKLVAKKFGSADQEINDLEYGDGDGAYRNAFIQALKAFSNQNPDLFLKLGHTSISIRIAVKTVEAIDQLENEKNEPVVEEEKLDLSDELEKKIKSLGLEDRYTFFKLDKYENDPITATIKLANLIEKTHTLKPNEGSIFTQLGEQWSSFKYPQVDAHIKKLKRSNTENNNNYYVFLDALKLFVMRNPGILKQEGIAIDDIDSVLRTISAIDYIEEENKEKEMIGEIENKLLTSELNSNLEKYGLNENDQPITTTIDTLKIFAAVFTYLKRPLSLKDLDWMLILVPEVSFIRVTSEYLSAKTVSHIEENGIEMHDAMLAAVKKYPKIFNEKGLTINALETTLKVITAIEDINKNEEQNKE